MLAAIHRLPDHIFWDDGFSYTELARLNVLGAADVTDTWLAELTRRRQEKLAPLDVAFAASHPEVGILMPM